MALRRTTGEGLNPAGPIPKTRRMFSIAFKQAGVRLVRDQGLTVLETAADIGVHRRQMLRWVKLAHAGELGDLPSERERRLGSIAQGRSAPTEARERIATALPEQVDPRMRRSGACIATRRTAPVSGPSKAVRVRLKITASGFSVEAPQGQGCEPEGMTCHFEG